jgi:tryptophan-rich sensory protein
MTSAERSYAVLAVYVLLVAAVAAFAAQFEPGDWYAQLSKPAWTPPNWLFAPVWTILYLMIAVAGWLIHYSTGRVLKFLWALQLLLNGIWSWLFFGLHLTGLALVDITALTVCIAALLLVAYRSMSGSGWLLLPYLVWVGYAATLNAAIYLQNIPGAVAR